MQLRMEPKCPLKQAFVSKVVVAAMHSTEYTGVQYYTSVCNTEYIFDEIIFKLIFFSATITCISWKSDHIVSKNFRIKQKHNFVIIKIDFILSGTWGL